MAAVTAATPTVVVAPYYPVGISYAALPSGAIAITKNGTTYYRIGNTWFKPSFGANGVHYVVVATP